MKDMLKFLAGAVAFCAVAFLMAAFATEALGSDSELGADELTVILAAGMAIAWFVRQRSN